MGVQQGDSGMGVQGDSGIGVQQGDSGMEYNKVNSGMGVYQGDSGMGEQLTRR